MLDLDNIKSGEYLSDEQLKDLFGKKEEKVENLPSEKGVSGKEPELKFNPEKGTFEAVDSKIQELREKRARLKNRNDPLADKKKSMEFGLEEIGISVENMGKTGDSRTGRVSDEQKKIAESQVEDAKEIMLRNRKQQQGR